VRAFSTAFFFASCHSPDFFTMKEQGPLRVNRWIRDRSHFEINPFASPLCMNYSSLSRTSRGSERPKCLPRKNCVGCYISNMEWNVRWHLSLVLSRVQERARDSTQVESWGVVPADIVSCFDRIPLRVRGTFSHLDTSMILNFLFFFGPDCGHICQRRAERYQYTHWYSARKPMSPVLMNIYENQFFL